jgi:cyclophilin family peptidyl-prolyl cis-trans isomerase
MMQNWFGRWTRNRRNSAGRRVRSRPSVEGLEERCLPSVIITPIPDKTMPSGKSLILPITANDTDGHPLTFTFTSDNDQVTVAQHTGNSFLKLSVAGFGDMTFELLRDVAPNTVDKITGLVNQGFYNNLTFHRIVPNFVIQGGDPKGDGTGGPQDRGISGFPFDNEFNLQAIFSGDGQLAMANSGRDTSPNTQVTGTNGSQFFITFGPQRTLDFNHTIFGQLVRGSDVAMRISQVQRGANDRPVTPVIITSATIVPDTSDAVITLNAAAGFTGFAKITVSASNGAGGTDNQVITVRGVTDIDPNTGQPLNDPAILNAVANQTTNKNTPVTFSLAGQDVENDPLEFAVDTLDTPGHATVSVNGSQVTVTPDRDFTGVIHLLAKVKDRGATSRGSTGDPFDTQKFTLTVNETGMPPPPTPGTSTSFVTHVYESLLGREPDGSGMDHYRSLLDQNQMTRAQMVVSIQSSLEGRTKQVQDFYHKYLGREADPQGLTLSILWLGLGGSMTQLRETIVSSPEYFQGHGRSSNSEYVSALYEDLLGRGVDPVGQGGAIPALNNGMTRSQLAAQIARSPEGLQAVVQSYYNLFLHRRADDTGLNINQQQLQRGVSEDSIVSNIAGSNEFFNRS